MLLIDNLDGDPKEFYALVKEEVLKREIPGVKFNDREEFRTKGFLSSESFPALYIDDGTNQVKVFAYQFARSFHVSLRTSWKDGKMQAKADLVLTNYVLSVVFECFTESVSRAVSSALSRYSAQKKITLTEPINPKDIFQGPQAQRS